MNNGNLSPVNIFGQSLLQTNLLNMELNPKILLEIYMLVAQIKKLWNAVW